MNRPSSLVLVTLLVSACADTVQPDSTVPDRSPEFSVLNVPGEFSSIQAAHDAAQSGDTVIVEPGVHVGQIVITKAITLASRFLTTGDPGYIDSTILDGDNGEFVIDIPSGSEEGVIIQGFTIRNAGDGVTAGTPFTLLNCVVTDTGDGIDYEDGSGGLVQFCTFELNSDDAIDIDRDIELVIADNVIGNSDDDGIEIRFQSYEGPTLTITITRNLIFGSGEDGIQVIGYGEATDRVLEITHNAIYGNDYSGIGMVHASDTHEAFQAADILETIFVFNNTFADNDHGISGGDNTVVLNNIFTNHTGIAVKNVDANSELSHNLFHNNGMNDSGSNVVAGSSVLADPLLGPAFELLPESPAVDRGTASYVWRGGTVLDLLPEAYSGAAPDIGAYESESPGGPVPDAPVPSSPADGTVDVGLTPTLSWTGEGDSFSVEVATDSEFSDIIETGAVPTNEYPVSAGILDYLTLYHWRVRAENAYGTSDYSAAWSFTTLSPGAPPDAPVLVSPADGATDVPVEATLDWSGTADDFDVEVATDGGFTSTVFSTNVSGTSTTLPAGALLNETVYFWRVRGNNSLGAGEYAASFSFTTAALPDTEPPSQPQNLTSPAKTTETVELLWDSSTDNVGVSSYTVYRDGDSIASVPTPAYVAIGLTAGTPYSFQVSAVDASENESPLSVPLVVTTEPAPLTGIRVVGISVELRRTGRWNSARAVVTIADEHGAPIDDADVEVQWSGLVTGLGAGTTSGGDVQFDSDRIPNSQAGQFSITVIDVTLDGFAYEPSDNVVTTGCVDTSGGACGPPDTDPPAAPASLEATGGPGAVSLEWADSVEPDLAGYSVYRSTIQGSAYLLIAEGVSESQYTDPDVVAGTTYYYVTTASDLSGNESAASNEASATPSEPVQLTVHVSDVSVSIVNKGINYSGQAAVRVVDQDGIPVSGVQVEGVWTLNSGSIGTDSGSTSDSGEATLDSAKRKAVSGDEFTFSVTGLTGGGYTYDPASDVETSDSATVP